MSSSVGRRRNVMQVGSSGRINHDILSDVPVNIDFIHDQIHRGLTYEYTGVFSLGIGGQKVFHIVTANTTTWNHLNLTGLMSPRGANSNVSVYHSAATGAGSAGTGLVLANLDANSDLSHITSVYENPSVTTTGTLLHREWVAAGNFTGGTNVSRNEVILKQDASHFL